MEKWKRLGSTYIFRRPWLTVRQDSYQLPDGRIAPEYYILEYPAWVNVIAITPAGEFVMVEQYRPGLDGIFTELVAGVAEPGEEPLEAARRELLEETGYGGGSWELFTVLSGNPGSTNNLTYTFVARDVTPAGDRRLDPTEDLDVKLLTEAQVRDLLASDQLKQSLMAAPLWKYFATRR